MKRDTQRAQMEAARLKNQETGVDIQTKQAALAGQNFRSCLLAIAGRATDLWKPYQVGRQTIRR